MNYFRFFVLVIAAGLLAGGCRKDDGSTQPQVTDNDVIMNQISSIDSVADFANTDDIMIDDQGDLPDGSLAKVMTPVKMFRWGRKVDRVVRSISVQFIGDSAAIATITKTVSGDFVIKVSYSDTAKAPDTTIRKSYVERARRKVLFARTGRNIHPEKNWLPVAITMVEGGIIPDSNNTFTISSMEISLPLGKDTITDPLNTWMKFNRLRHGIPIMRAGDSARVVLTTYSTDPDTERVFLRSATNMMGFGMKTLRDRMQLVSSTPDGSGWVRVYSKSFKGDLSMGMAIGRFNAVVDVISHGSFFDDTALFSNRFWGLPYMVLFR